MAWFRAGAVMAALVFVATACARGAGGPVPVGTPATAPLVEEPLPPYEPADGDVYPNAKRLAGRLAQALGTYTAGSRPEDVAQAAAQVTGADPATLLPGLAWMVEPTAASVGEVEYAQLGGLTADSASVMVVLRQYLRPEEAEPVTLVRVLDVRLRLAGAEWAVDGLASDGGAPEDAPAEPSPIAKAVLDDPRVHLPDSGRWDVRRGQVDDDILALIGRIAERHEIRVAVLLSGHPINVFGGDKQSNHTKGRAVDIYAIDGELVVRQRQPGTPAHTLALWLFEQGVTELGGPWDFDPPGGRSFTDVVHQDHLHVAVAPPADGGL